MALTVPDTPLAAAVGLPLTIGVVDERDVIGPTPLRYAFLTVIDMLAYGTAMRGGANAQEKLRRIKQHLDNLAVMHLATSKQEVQRPSFAVNTGMDLGGPATTADADVLRFLPPLWNGPPLNSTLIGLGNRRAI